MRILLAAKTMGVGGLERIVVALARELRQRGHEVWVVSSGGELVAGLGRVMSLNIPDLTLLGSRPYWIRRRFAAFLPIFGQPVLPMAPPANIKIPTTLVSYSYSGVRLLP